MTCIQEISGLLPYKYVCLSYKRGEEDTYIVSSSPLL